MSEHEARGASPDGPAGLATDAGTGAGRPALPTDPHAGIVVRGVRRHFGAVRAVDGVDLEARPGAVTALIGPNGSGKTTLLLVLAGLLRPDAGSVHVAGVDLLADPAGARARVGWMPDAFGTWDTLTAREILTTFARAYRVPADTVAVRVPELLETVHLTELADRPAHVLSRGQKQRLGLARALVHDPQVLLLDEPASGLDPRSRVDLRVLLRELAGQGRTVLVSSHVLTELDEMADDAVFVSGGRSVAAQSVADARATRRPWRLRALSQAGLVRWLDDAGLAWRADHAFTAPAEGPGGVLVELDSEQAAADLLRTAVGAGVPVTALTPASGALESTYLALEEDRR